MTARSDIGPILRHHRRRRGMNARCGRVSSHVSRVLTALRSGAQVRNRAMPTYVYECSKCDEEIEVWQSFADDPLKRHSGCGGKLTKVLQPVGIVLKGSGFYK